MTTFLILAPTLTLVAAGVVCLAGGIERVPVVRRVLDVVNPLPTDSEIER